ncbi:GTPase-activating protein [Apophysomyces ossiformis]|uniref:GTPase-activating protein n=1 Tax=Apophysomyces ossiformis TaxID=679940 RepID=A0A8H7BW76_9FUNG|nr:GTPase-activating protein [Apophysomyces ossiformis]
MRNTVLTEQGLLQAKAVGERLACESFEKVYCSDLTRCKQTADAIMAHHPSTPIDYRVGLRERDFGTLCKKPIRFLTTESLRLNVDVDELVRRHRGETEDQFANRLIQVYEEIVTEALNANYSHILIITHGGPLHVFMLCWVNRLGYKVADGQINLRRCGNTAVTRICIQGLDQGLIEFYNSMTHLDTTQQTAPPEQNQSKTLDVDGSPFDLSHQGSLSQSSTSSPELSDQHSFASIDTMASIEEDKPVKPSRRRGFTVTQHPKASDQHQDEQVQGENKKEKIEEEEEKEEVMEASTKNNVGEDAAQQSATTATTATTTDAPRRGMVDLRGQIHGLRQDVMNDSDSDNESMPAQSHRSTMLSINSFLSSASNYDLLLERLGAPESEHTHQTTTTHSQTSSSSTPPQEPPENEPTDANLTEEDIDWEFWSKVISDFDSVAKSEPKVLSVHVQRGVPPALRGMIWQLFARSKDNQLEDLYMQLLKQESVYEKAIARDLERIFPHHDYFQTKDGQEALFNVVKAYSLYDADVGYSQGIAYIAGPLLMNMPEEEAFCVLVQLMRRYSLRGHFTPNMDLLHQRLYQFDGLLKDHLPHIARHFESQGIRSHMYASQWFITILAYKFPLDMVFRIYDVVFADGIDILHRISLALMEKNQSTILSLDFDVLIHYLKNDILETYESDTTGLIRDAYKIQIVPKRFNKLAKEYQAEMAKTNTETEIVESLRKQNKALSETIRQLEITTKDQSKENALVASQLIESKMEIARINDENDALRQQAHDLKKALETLPTELESRVREEMEILCTKNAALVQRNSALEDQLAYMENMLIDMKVKYAESENDRENLRQRLGELKRMMEPN